MSDTATHRTDGRHAKTHIAPKIGHILSDRSSTYFINYIETRATSPLFSPLHVPSPRGYHTTLAPALRARISPVRPPCHTSTGALTLVHKQSHIHTDKCHLHGQKAKLLGISKGSNMAQWIPFHKRAGAEVSWRWRTHLSNQLNLGVEFDVFFERSLHVVGKRPVIHEDDLRGGVSCVLGLYRN